MPSASSNIYSQHNHTNAYTYPMSSSPIPNQDPLYTDLTSYTRTMHKHTKKQMEAASQSARRCSSPDDSSMRSYKTKESMGSVDSRAS